MNYFTLIPLIIFTVAITIFEGMYFHLQRRSGKLFPYVHEILMVLRLSMIVMFVMAGGTWWLVAASFFLFPIVHDGIYYETRNYFSPGLFAKGYRDHSKEDTSLMSIPWSGRKFLAYIGAVFIVLHIIFTHNIRIWNLPF